MQHPLQPRAARALLATAALFLAACGSDSGEPPQTVTWSIELQSPNGDEGAVVLEVDDEVAEARAPAGTRVMINDVGAVTRVVVVRDQPGTITLELDLVEGGPAPSVTVVEVSGPDDALRPSTREYSVSVRGRS